MTSLLKAMVIRLLNKTKNKFSFKLIRKNINSFAFIAAKILKKSSDWK